MKRFIKLLAIFLLLAACAAVATAQTRKTARVGYLSPSADSARLEAFRQGLRELGYVENQNVLIEPRYAEGKLDRLPTLVGDLVQLNVDVIVVQGTQAAIAAKHATSTTPIIVGGAGDLVGEGLVANLARPGGNVTGFTNIDPDLSAKRLQLLREILPKVARVAVLYHGGPGGDQEELRETQTVAKSLGVQIQALRVLEPDQFQRALRGDDQGACAGSYYL